MEIFLSQRRSAERRDGAHGARGPVKEFGVPNPALKNLPKQELFILRQLFPEHWSGPESRPREHLGSRQAISLFERWKCRRRKRTKGGEVRIA